MKWFVKSMGRLTVITLLLLSVVACSDNGNLTNASSSAERSDGTVSLDVYKSQTCGCCKKWVDHVEASGFEAVLHHPADLNKLKADKGISPRYQSCHTAVSNDGYVFEGHIPAHIILQFLADPPQNAIGLSVPDMPVGSPGMEMGNLQDDYDVLLLKQDGDAEVYEHVSAKR